MSKTDIEEINILRMYLKELNEEYRVDLGFDPLPLFQQLTKAETLFLKKLRTFKEGKKVYVDFLYFINTELADARELRPYLREGQGDFKTIMKSIAKHVISEVYKIAFNYKFCLFAMRKLAILENLTPESEARIEELKKLMEQMKLTRNAIVEKHLYLAVHKAKVFSQKNGSSALEFSDFIQAANEGLMDSVDKFVLSMNSKFHHVAQGRIIAYLLTLHANQSSATTLGTAGLKKLGKIRKFLQDSQSTLPNMSEALKIAEEDINFLVNSIKYMSLDQKVFKDSDSKFLGEYLDIEDGKQSVEDEIVQNDLLQKMKESYSILTILERKILILEGVDL